VPGAEKAPDNQAPQDLDHYKRGYHERASLRDREMGEVSRDSYIPRGRDQSHAFDAAYFADVICRPGCNVMLELDRARDANPGNFSTGKPITAILSQLARRRKLGIASAVWDWMDGAGIEKNVYHYNTMISVAEKTKDQRRAMQLFHEMERRKIKKNEVT
jgi:pentatricopeptide repeat protein